MRHSHVLIDIGKLLPTEVTDHLHLQVDVSKVFIEIIFSVGCVVTETADNVLLFVSFDAADTAGNQPRLYQVVLGLQSRGRGGGLAGVENTLTDVEILQTSTASKITHPPGWLAGLDINNKVSADFFSP